MRRNNARRLGSLLGVIVSHLMMGPKLVSWFVPSKDIFDRKAIAANLRRALLRRKSSAIQ